LFPLGGLFAAILSNEKPMTKIVAAEDVTISDRLKRSMVSIEDPAPRTPERPN
jgi:hypothetical protein